MYGQNHSVVVHQSYSTITYQVVTINFPYPTYASPPPPFSEPDILAVQIARHYPEPAAELAILLNPNYVDRNLRIYTIRQAMDMLRKANEFPHALPRCRTNALDMVLKPLISGENTIYRLPARCIAAALFNDLDLALFNGMLRRRVYIGRGRISANLLGCMSINSARGVQIDISTKAYDEEMRGQHVGYRMRRLIETVVHEMCHAFLPALCAPGCQVADYDIRGADVPDGHGVYFGEALGLVQKIFDCRNIPVDMNYEGRYQLFEVVNH